jgi:hypothetical protein
MEEDIKALASNWIRAIETRSPKDVVELYHPNAVLWGTLANEFRHGHEKITGYFIKFLQRENISCDIKNGFVRIYEGFAFYSGAYEFTWRVADKSIIVPARFSFVYINENGKWLIIEHHSSLYPGQQFKLKNFIISDP